MAMSLNFIPLPPGFRFEPTKEQAIVILNNKISNNGLVPGNIRDVDIYKYSPEQLFQMYKSEGKDMFFFTRRERKHPRGIGTYANRLVGDQGYWKATGLTLIGNRQDPIGYKRALVFHRGKGKQATKTYWIMHEYTTTQKSAPSTSTAPNNMGDVDGWVLCKIYEKMQKVPKLPEFSEEDYAFLDSILVDPDEPLDFLTGDEPQPVP